jgi:Xaa-Pro aminopeptidase
MPRLVSTMMMMTAFVALATFTTLATFLALSPLNSAAQQVQSAQQQQRMTTQPSPVPAMPHILSLEERAALQDSVLLLRLQRLAPTLMRREGVTMWVLIGREYHEDPVLRTMLPATWLSARRRTILVLFDTGKNNPDGSPAIDCVERLAVARYDVGTAGKFFRSAWNPSKQPDQFKRLAELIAERKPATIALNRSTTFAHADGLTETEYQGFMQALASTTPANTPTSAAPRVVNAEKLCVGWLETRLPEEMAYFPDLCKITHAIIAEGFRAAVVKPGVTTTSDMEWWFRERIAALGLSTWFHPSVSIQRADPIANTTAPSSAKPGSERIMAGDLLHVDIGVSYLGLNSDVQQHAYVCKPNETEAPAGIKAAFVAGNRSQDILTSQFKNGRTGNAILKAALEQAQKENIKATIYSHPIGAHGHAAGPALGMWDNQGVVQGTGDAVMNPSTAYSIELNAETPIAEWGMKPVRIMLEEDGFWAGDAGGFRYLDGRQTSIIIIRP